MMQAKLTLGRLLKITKQSNNSKRKFKVAIKRREERREQGFERQFVCILISIVHMRKIRKSFKKRGNLPHRANEQTCKLIV